MTALCQADGCRIRARHWSDCADDTCAGCIPRQAMPGAAVCEVCEDRAWKACQDIAAKWDDTAEQLTRSMPHGEPVKASREPGLDLNPNAVERRALVRTTVHTWGLTLLEVAPTLDGRDALKAARARLEAIVRDPRRHGEIRGARVAFRRARAHVRSVEAWDTPWLAGWLGSNIRHLTAHHDEREAVAFVDEITRMGAVVRSLAAPKGARTYAPGIPCVEHGTDDQGQRVPCAGTYEARVWDGMGVVPDLRCTVDGSHVLTPAGFRRLGRRVSPDQAAMNLLAAVGRVGA